MTVSQNGWGVISSSTSNVLRPWRIGPVTFTGRTGAAGFMLAHFTQWFHEEIEPLWPDDMQDNDDHWWGLRQISGTSVWSNHASATAVDLNARRHPQGTEPEQTFTSTECVRIRKKMTEKYEGALKWGGDFRTTPDPMHIELQEKSDFPAPVIRSIALDLVSTPVGKRLIASQSKSVNPDNW